MDFRSLVIPIGMKEEFTMVFADSIPVRALSVNASIVSRIETLPL